MTDERRLEDVPAGTATSAPEVEPLTVLVTGTSGLVGASVVAALRPRFKTRGVDRASGSATDIVGDLREPAVRSQALSGIWALVHAAALHAPHVGVVADTEFWEVNVDATRALVSEAEAAGVQRFVYTSSTSVYGHALVPTGEEAVWVDESLQPAPRDIYDETKLVAEGIVTRSTIPAVVLRIARCFPEPPEIMAAHRLYRGVDVWDVAVAHALALEHPEVEGTFNVGGPLLFKPTDTRHLWTDAQSLIRQRLPGIALTFDENSWRLPQRIDRVYDSRLACRVLGYRPTGNVLSLDQSGGR